MVAGGWQPPGLGARLGRAVFSLRCTI
jgi:hypothetical protein